VGAHVFHSWKEVARFEKMMRAPQGSAEWKEYWQNESTQREYRAALERDHAPMPAAEPAPARTAPVQAAPAVPVVSGAGASTVDLADRSAAA
jgi:hypothetical protein